MLVHYTPSISLVAGPTSLAGQFLLGIGTGLGGNLATAGVNAVLGWAANQLGLNYGTAGQLQEISAQLSALTATVDQAITAAMDQTLTDKLSAANSLFTPAVNADTDLQTSINDAVITNSPFSPPTSLGTVGVRHQRYRLSHAFGECSRRSSRNQRDDYVYSTARNDPNFGNGPPEQYAKFPLAQQSYPGLDHARLRSLCSASGDVFEPLLREQS